MTRAREIPLDTLELRAAVAQGVGHEGSLLINAVAEIEVLTAGDRWLTWAFKRTRPEMEFALTLPLLPRNVGQLDRRIRPTPLAPLRRIGTHPTY
jgi:hypothetical protein